MMAFKNSALFRDHVKVGKASIKGEHRARIKESKNNKVLESLDFDRTSTLRQLNPSSKRWDYFLSTSTEPKQLIALEVHQFKVAELRQKKEDTKEILANHCPQALEEITGWHVIVTGDIRSDQAARFSADSGIKLHRTLVLSQR